MNHSANVMLRFEVTPERAGEVNCTAAVKKEMEHSETLIEQAALRGSLFSVQRQPATTANSEL